MRKLFFGRSLLSCQHLESRISVQCVEAGVNGDSASAGGVFAERAVQPGESTIAVAQGRVHGGNLVRQRLAIGQRFELGQQLAGLLGMAVSGVGIGPHAEQIAPVVGHALGPANLPKRLVELARFGVDQRQVAVGFAEIGAKLQGVPVFLDGQGDSRAASRRSCPRC